MEMISNTKQCIHFSPITQQINIGSIQSLQQASKKGKEYLITNVTQYVRTEAENNMSTVHCGPACCDTTQSCRFHSG
jgi:hypothetical protein